MIHYSLKYQWNVTTSKLVGSRYLHANIITLLIWMSVYLSCGVLRPSCGVLPADFASWLTFSLLLIRQVILCKTWSVSDEYCSPTLTSLISHFEAKSKGAGNWRLLVPPVLTLCKTWFFPQMSSKIRVYEILERRIKKWENFFSGYQNNVHLNWSKEDSYLCVKVSRFSHHALKRVGHCQQIVKSHSKESPG